MWIRTVTIKGSCMYFYYLMKLFFFFIRFYVLFLWYEISVVIWQWTNRPQNGKLFFEAFETSVLKHLTDAYLVILWIFFFFCIVCFAEIKIKNSRLSTHDTCFRRFLLMLIIWRTKASINYDWNSWHAEM